MREKSTKYYPIYYSKMASKAFIVVFLGSIFLFGEVVDSIYFNSLLDIEMVDFNVEEGDKEKEDKNEKEKKNKKIISYLSSKIIGDGLSKGKTFESRRGTLSPFLQIINPPPEDC